MVFMGQACTYLHFRMRHLISFATLLFPVLLTAQVSVSFLQSNVTCFGQCDGFSTAVGFGGAFPYSYVWSNGNNTATISSLCAGTYTVTVSDANQNTVVDSVTITQPNQLTVAVATENQICGIAPDGAAHAIASGGTAPYTYLWSNGSTGDFLGGLSEGTYTVTVTDVNGCTAVGSGSVYFWNEGIWLMIMPTNILCYGQNNGTVHVGPMSGTPPYTYEWSSPGGSSQDLINLPPGDYTVTVTDANGCSNSASATVTEPPPLTATTATTPAACGTPGSATVTASGGTPPYSVLWSNGSATTTINGSAGPVSVSVTDANGCLFTLNLNIPGNNTTLTVTGQVLSQAGCLTGGSASVSVSGGGGTYVYVWTSNDSTAVVNNLAAGTYTVTVTDLPTACTGTASIVILPFASTLSVDAVVNSPATCLSGGSATATATGGVPPYSYHWDNGDSTATAGNLTVGIHIVTATDSTGCTATDTIQIGHSPLPAAAIQITGPVTCLAGGQLLATGTGGIPPYTYHWNNSDSTAAATSLPAGTYTITITDAGGCTATASVTLAPPLDPVITVTVLSNATCTTPGSAAASASGGLPPYGFIWDNSATTDTVTNLSAGTHSVTVVDAGGCKDTASIVITQPEAPVASIQVNTLANCLGGGGSATATATGGTTPYGYSWNNGDITATVNNLTAGTYTVIVTDAGGCKDTAAVVIAQLPNPTVAAQMNTLANCLGGGGSATANPAGGTAPYEYDWSNGDSTATATNLAAATYTVTVTDAAGCTASATVTISQVASPTVAITITAQATCNTLASAVATGAGGTSPYAYKWSNGQTTATASGLTPGTYVVTVTDAAGCTALNSVVITAPPLPSASILSQTNASCTGPGTATAGAAGGTPPYSYLWDNAETTAAAVNLAAGIHTVTVTDAGGCTATATVNIAFDNTGGVKVGDFVWFDNDQNGAQHPLEPGAPNIHVKLVGPGPDGDFQTADDVIVDTSVTDSKGKYLFECVPPGAYIIVYSQLPAGYQFTAKDNVNNDCADSDANAGGNTDPFTITGSQGNNLCVDAGIHVVCQNVTNAGIICCNQTICEGDTPALLYESQPPANGSGTLEYVWMEVIPTTSGLPTYVAVPGATGATYQPGPLFETASYIRCVRRQGCTTFLETNIVTITVLPAGSTGCSQFSSNFSAKALNHSTIQVKWITGPEMLKYLYTVEHSVNKVLWTTIRQVVGRQDNDSPNQYEVMDHSPAAGMNYYRLKRQSASGVVSLSEIREVNMEIPLEASLSVYPNPVAQVLYIHNLIPYDSDTQVEIFSTSGQLIQALKIPAGTLQTFELPVANLPQGIYLTRLRINSKQVTTLKIAKF